MLFESEQIDQYPGFARLNPGTAASFDAVATDSRAFPSGALFVALRGDRFDGHDFIPDALARGAGGLVVSVAPATLPPIPVWQVEDTLHALGELARAYRERFSMPVLALTGTTGKTTTKELIRSMFSRRTILVNEGNFNNLIGVPLTLFRMGTEHRYGAIEIGMNRFGEIGRLTQIVRPTLGLINNIGPGHLEGVENLDGVLRAKTELAREMPAEFPLILNADDPLLRRFGQGSQRRIVWFGLRAGSHVSARNVEQLGLNGQRFSLVTPHGEVDVELRLPGEHNLRNALAATAAALEMGLPLEEIKAGLEQALPFRLRNEVLTGPRGARIIADCYNANPASMREALRILRGARGEGRTAAVLGDMLELGEAAPRYHVELGEQIAAAAPDRVWLVGEWAPVVARTATGVETSVAKDLDALTAEVGAWLRAGDTLLVKGSRGVKLDRVVAGLRGEGTEH